ncbi:MAG: ABC transporter, partial [Lachnospiraceae bacterium]|nr:ABC transporter [Lachnospiraceae bacterium]
VGDIEKLCKRIIIVNNGQIVLDDSMQHLKYNYLNKKVVEIKLHEEAELPATEGIVILKKNGGHIKFEVDTSILKINEALHCIDADNMEDINISNIPLEDIITQIYKAEGRKEAVL